MPTLYLSTDYTVTNWKGDGSPLSFSRVDKEYTYTHTHTLSHTTSLSIFFLTFSSVSSFVHFRKKMYVIFIVRQIILISFHLINNL
eukprot:NP_510863.2 Uncharacterized protein CELE_6R55.2 [Caenorhabditis elegans]